MSQTTTHAQEAAQQARRKWIAVPAMALAFSILVIGLVVLIMEPDPANLGEPFAWAAGISLWPSIMIRTLACVLCWIFVYKVLHDLPALQTNLTKRFFLQDRKPLTPSLAGLARWQKPWQFKLKDGARDMQTLWDSYREATQADFLKRRAIQCLSIYLAFGVCLVYAFGMPLVPYRGSVSLIIHWLVLVPTIIGFVYLIMLIIDATRYCIRLIQSMDIQRLNWPEKALTHFGFEGARPFVKEDVLIDAPSGAGKLRQALAKNHQLEHWLDIQFITALTKGIGNLIYYPFIILALLVFALTPIFDNWHIPIGLALVFILSALLTLICSLLLRRAAEHARNSALRSLTIALMAVRGREEKSAKIVESQLVLAIDQIKSIREGAFLPLTHEPAIQALLLPLGGWGGFTLLEHIVLSGA